MLTKQIVHLADLHIGSDEDRVNEYNRTFDIVQSFLARIPEKEHTIAVVCGDIFHHKSRYSGEDVQLFDTIMTYIGDEIPCIVIPGNHDVVPAGNRVDLITPLIEKLNTVYPVYYITRTSQRELLGLHITHVNVLDTKVDEVALSPPIQSTLPRVLLYHGMVNGATFGKHVHSASLLSTNFINKFDYVFLGDIHEHQYITPRIAYPGSLIQQNLDESAIKGLILWDLVNKTSRFVRINNRSGMIRLDIRNMSEQQVIQHIKTIEKPDNLIKLSVICDDLLPESAIQNISKSVGNITYVQRHNTILIDPARNIGNAIRQLLAGEATTEEIESIITMQNPAVNYRKYSITLLKWDNFFRYGKGNVIDFTALSGLTGIVANNMSGKSSVIDIIVFALWGKLLRGDRKSMINVGAENSYVEISLTADKFYRIVRTDTISKRTTLRLYSRVAGGDEIDETAVNTETTYRKIRTIVGDLLHFQLTNLFNNPNIDIINANPTDRIRYVLELFGVTENSQKITESKKKVVQINKNISALVKPRDAAPSTYDIAVLKNERDLLRQQRDNISLVKYIARDPTTVEVEINAAQKKLITLGDEPPYVPPCRPETLSMTESIDAKKECRSSVVIAAEIALINPQSKPMPQIRDIAKLNTQLADLSEMTPRESLQATINTLSQQLTNIDIKQFDQLNLLRTQLKSSTAFHKDQINDLEFSSDCTCCNINRERIESSGTGDTTAVLVTKINFITQQKQNYATLTEQLTRLKAEECSIQAHNVAVARSSSRRAAIETELKEAIQTNEFATALRKRTEELRMAQRIENAVKKNERMIAYRGYMTYKSWKDNQSANESISARINALNNELKICKETYPLAQAYDLSHATWKDLNQRIGMLDTHIIEEEYKAAERAKELAIRETYERELQPLEQALRREKLYLSVLKSPTLQNEIIRTGMTTVIQNANTVLTNFGFTLDMELNNGMFLYIVTGHRRKLPVDMASGVQRFTIALALRLALCQSLPLPEFMIIDEGFGAADEININKLKHILHELSGSFSFLFCISHIMALQNALIRPLTIHVGPETSSLANIPVVDTPTITQVVCECGKTIPSNKLETHLQTKLHNAIVRKKERAEKKAQPKNTQSLNKIPD